MFSHGPMSEARGPKVLLGIYSHTLKVQNCCRGGPWPRGPHGSATALIVNVCDK